MKAKEKSFPHLFKC